jgi:hypothetical protein
MNRRKIASVSTIRKLHDPLSRKEDRSYWLSQSPISRFNAVDEIRQEFHIWKYGYEPRFQRVYRIIKHK